jgi:hypothetical protein
MNSKLFYGNALPSLIVQRAQTLHWMTGGVGVENV